MANTFLVSAITISAFIVTGECGSVSGRRMSKSYYEYRYGRYASHKISRQTRQNVLEEKAPPMEFAPPTTTTSSTTTSLSSITDLKTTAKPKYKVNLNEEMVNNLISRGKKQTVLCSLNDLIINSVKKFIKRHHVTAKNRRCKGELKVAYSPLPPFIYKENNTIKGLLPSKILSLIHI